MGFALLYPSYASSLGGYLKLMHDELRASLASTPALDYLTPTPFPEAERPPLPLPNIEVAR
jgi:hypothetical protein